MREKRLGGVSRFPFFLIAFWVVQYSAWCTVACLACHAWLVPIVCSGLSVLSCSLSFRLCSSGLVVFFSGVVQVLCGETTRDRNFVYFGHSCVQ
ncbi:MAG: hypothetical protein JOS17DRAFT_761784 [Linnemannia elongata]|nr:MAG: hypothetical protein JOS17DRAFT_761784 [Linnemannia elongata]